jgi:hypothetical protein
MQSDKKFRLAIRMPEVSYLPKNHLAKEEGDESISEEIRLGLNQIETLCRKLESEFATETQNITSFKNYLHPLKSHSHELALQEVKNFLHEMRGLEEEYKGDNISKFFLNHWAQYGEDFYFILKSIDLAGIRVVRDSRLLANLTDEQKIEIYLESY